MKEVNPIFFMKPWQEQSNQKIITETNQIQSILYGMHTYFHHANPRPKGGALYMNIWVASNTTHEEIIEEL